MFRKSMLAALVVATSLVAVSGVGAALVEYSTTNPSSLEMPEGYSPGLWFGLPEEDRRAIHGEPYPNLLFSRPPVVDDGVPGPAPPDPSDGEPCWGFSPVPSAC